MENKIDNYESATALIVEDAYNHGQQLPIVLRIDWEEQEITARVVYERNSTPSAVWHGRQSEYMLPGNVDACDLREWVQSEIVPLADRAVQYYSTVWNGSNHVGCWERNDDGDSPADEILEEIREICQADAPELSGDSPGLWDVREWAADSVSTITAETTDDQIRQIADDIESAAISDNVVLTGPDVYEWLIGGRDELREF